MASIWAFADDLVDISYLFENLHHQNCIAVVINRWILKANVGKCALVVFKYRKLDMG